MDSTSEGGPTAQTRIRQQSVVAELGKQALETDDLDQLLRDASVAVAELLHDEYCEILELTSGGDEVVLRQGIGWRDGLVGTATVPAGPDSQTGYTLRTEGPVIVEDVRTEERFSAPELLTSHDIVSGISVIIGSAEDPWGVLGVYSATSREFTDHDAQFVQDVADVLTAAITREERDRELRSKERRYEAIFEDPTILVGLLGPDGTVLDINGTAMEYVDATLDDVTGVPFWETPWWGEDDGIRDDVREWVERAANGEYVDFKADLSRPDGEPYTLNGYFRPVTDDDGEVVSILVSDRDVTEHKVRKRTLEKSEQRYRTLVEHFPNGAVTLVDENIRYRTVGGSPYDVAGVTVEEVEGQPVGEIVPPKLADELVPRYEAAFDGESSAFELELNDRIYQFQVVPVRDGDGDVFAALGMSQNITEREEAKRKLEESERRHRTLVENFPNGAVALFDEDLRYSAAGGQLLEAEGIDPADRIGVSIRELYPDEIVEKIEPYFQAALEGEASSFETEYLDRHLFSQALPIRNADDEVYAGMLVVQDISEQRTYERKLEESNERLEQFAYAASHDLQEPLRMVSSYLQLVENRYADELDEDGREFVAFAVDGADRMRAMIEGLLQYSRVDARGDPFEPVDLDEVFADVRQNLQVKIQETDADITVEDLPRVHGDGSQLNQVFQNLLSNAIEYSGDEPPRVYVGAERDGDQWIISVNDEGIGIDPADAERVFEIFQSLRGHEDAGTGIGLALVKRIVERHDGDVWIDSEPGEGATFSFTLPAAGETDE
ncbi:PAS domain-containing protein [Halomontanus rarus]|uniref:PAS domain-containing protein n=1 Tax=Halomontanus rarus TaxID=3034020 RepID=UPI0023E88487|nr:PAS domain-containing protein [Halovivax sp. TS33]